MTTDDAHPGAGSKGTLFCPDCDHRSRYDGDWRVVETARGLSYRCPDCQTEITTRRSDGTRRATGPRRTVCGRTLAAWQTGVENWERLWWRTVLPA